MQQRRRKAWPNPPRNIFPLFRAGTMSGWEGEMVKRKRPNCSLNASKACMSLPEKTATLLYTEGTWRMVFLDAA
jgi:hypothetical protein